MEFMFSFSNFRPNYYQLTSVKKKLIATSKLGILSSFVLFGMQAHSQTLIDVYKQAQENDHTYRAARANYEAGLESKNLGRSALLPQINGNISLTDTDTSRKGSSFFFDDQDTKDESRSYSISLSQTLFNLSTWYEYKNSKIVTNIAEVNFEQAKQDLVLRTAQAYFDTLQATEDLETSKAQEVALMKQLEQAKQRFEVGLIAVTEVHEAQAAYDSARAEKLNAQGAVGIAFDALEVLTGRPYVKISPFKQDFPVEAPQPSDRQEWIDMALQNNPDLKAQSLNAEAFKQTAKARKADHYPTLDGSVSLFKSDNDQTINDTPSSNLATDVTEISITLNVPIFSGLGTSAARRQANHESIAAREQYLQTQRNTVQSARSLHLSVLTGVATVDARKQAIISSSSAYEATNAGYEVGTRDLVDVLNAQRSVFQAERDHDTALYDYVINALNLKAVAGVLGEKDIAELNNWLDNSAPVTRH